MGNLNSPTVYQEYFYPLTSVQQVIWLDQMLSPESPCYNLGAILEIDGPFDPEVLQSVFNEVANANDALRLVLYHEAGLAQQYVVPSVNVTMESVDFSACTDARERAREHMQASFRTPFKLDGDLPWKVQLVRESDTRAYLMHWYHHIIVDGTSISLICQAVTTLYNRRKQGDAKYLASGFSYLDFLVDDQDYLASPRYEQDAEFWRRRFEMSPPPPLFAPNEKSRAVEGSGNSQVLLTISRSQYEALKTLARGFACTIAHAMTAILALYFARAYRVEEVVIGVPVHNRGGVRRKNAIGAFASVIPLGIPVDTRMSFGNLIVGVAGEMRRCYRHQRFPIADINRQLRLVQSGRRQAFDVSFSLEEFPADIYLGDTKLGVGAIRHRFDQTPLAVHLQDYHEGEHVLMEFNYDTEIFDRESVEDMLCRIELLMASVLEDGGHGVIGSLSWLSAEERQRMLCEWNATATEYPKNRFLHTLFEQHAEERPQAIAVAEGDAGLSYRELNRRSNRLAHFLRGQGVVPDSLVAICVERSALMVVSLLAILKAGGAYVPLDPAYPQERLLYMVEDSQPVVVLADSVGQRALNSASLSVPCVDIQSDATLWEGLPEDNLDPDVVGLISRHLAYVIYTSGSTGRPKGVMVEQGNLNSLITEASVYDVQPGDRILQFASLSFDASVGELVMALASGACLCLADRDAIVPGEALLETLRNQRITHMVLPPSAMALCDPERLPSSVRVVIAGGEALPGHTARSWARHVRLFNAYGPTEITLCATVHILEPDSEGQVPIGRPTANMRVYILDQDLQPVPVGIEGELYIGGDGVARGYRNLPGLTLERFLPDPFSGAGRMYRTGDLGRWRSEGVIEYLGRNDQQVKIRGFRIEPGEIEAVLGEVEEVREVVVVALEGGAGGSRLVAYYTGEGVCSAELRDRATRRLPAYMVPAAYVYLQALPLTPNGKVDRRRLPSPDDQAYGVRLYEAPLGEVEETLARLWSELLQVERIGRRDNFFELGGHSLLAVQLVSRLRREGLYVDVGALFNASTLAELAARIGDAGDTVEVPPNRIPEGADVITPEMLSLARLSQGEIERIVETVEGGAGNVQEIYPLGPLQEGILFHSLASREEDPYVLRARLGFERRERLEGFLGALQQVLDRHEVLRTGFAWEGLEEPVQVVWRRARLPVEFVETDAGEARLEIRCAPLLQCRVFRDQAGGRWILTLLVHHLAMDHTALEVLLEETRAIAEGGVDRLPAPQPYRNYVARARLGLQRQDHEAFFRAQLGGIEEPTAPFGLLDVQGDGSGIREGHRELSGSLSERLRAQARRLGVSAASVMHLGWALVLSRITGQEEVVFGTVLFGRMHGGAEAERGLGLYINTLPIRLTVSEQSLEAGLKEVHGLLVELLRHEHAPLSLAQGCSGLAAQTPLFSSLFNYRHSAGEAREGKGLLGEGIELLAAQERTNYPLNLSVDDLGDGFRLTVQVVQSVDAQRVCDFMERGLEGLVGALERGDDCAVVDLEVVPEEEWRRVVYDWNETACDDVPACCLQELFERRAEQNPQAIAVVDGELVLSYGELNRRSNRLAYYLRERGVGPDRLVAVCMERSVSLIVSQLAVLKAGGAYVPLDPAYPEVRLISMVEESRPAVVLVDEVGKAALGAEIVLAASCCVDVQGEVALWQGLPADNPRASELGLAPHHLAYVIFTSGSTGEPKGVMVEHRSLVNLIAWHEATFEVGAGSCGAHLAGIGFDASVWEQWSVLCSGGSLLLPPRGLEQDPQGLLEWWRVQALEVGFLVTPLAELAYATGRVNPQQRTLLIGGDRLRCWPEGIPEGQCLVNNYGPTETTVVATSGRLQRSDGTANIGRPIRNTRVYLLDSYLRPAPVGVAGEIFIGGVQVARGYLNRAELTAERFLEDPFRAGERIYKTGDLGRWREDGSVEFLGRNDQQVKIRGFRIEPGEIEAVLGEMEEVREVVVTAREGGSGGPRLVAYYTGEEALGVEVLRDCVARRLPAYMVPAAYVHLRALPLTPNGKVDRRGLPEPGDGAYGVSTYKAPVGEVEETVARLWRELLQVERIGRRDNFFELGGHSLLAVRLISRLRQELDVELPVGRLFEHPELAELAVCVEASSSSSAAIPATDRSGPLPLSPAQQRLWFLTQMEGVSRAYHISGALRLEGRLDRSVLERALRRIVERHEALRTCFVWLDGDAAQVVREAVEVPFEYRDLGDAREGEAAARVLCEIHVEGGFDLSRDLPLRVLLVRLQEQVHVLQVVMHHIASDGWSVGLFLDELNRLYRAFLNGEADPLPALSIQYADYAVWQRERLSSGVLEAQSAFWRERLGGAPALLELPCSRPRPAQQRYEGASLTVRLEGGLRDRLSSLCRRHGVTLYMGLLASWGAVLGRLSGQDEVVIGSPVAGRNRGEVEPLIGFFVNTLALRINLRGEPGVSGLLSRVKEEVLSAQAHQDLPFDQVVEAVRPPRSTAHAPLFQVMFAWQTALSGELRLPGVEVRAWEVPLNTAQYDLTLSLEERAGGIEGSLNYATSLFDEETVGRYLGYWRRCLEGMLEDESTPVARLPLLSAQERRQLLHDWSGAERDCLENHTIPQWFEQRARQTPDVVAVIDGDRRLTYRALDEKANRLAHAMIVEGLKPGDRVGVALPRSIELILAELAVVKAGAAYVPLDDMHPEARQAFMLEDCNARLLLTRHDRASPATRQKVVRIDLDRVDLGPYPATPPARSPDGGSAAYIMYTSGSTGTPKGVVIPHSGVVRLAIDNGYLDFKGEERVAFAATPAFDASTLEVWGPLLNGGTVVVVDADTLLEASRLASLIEAQKIRVMFLTTSLFNQHTLAIPRVLSHLRCLLCGGERADAAAFARLLAIGGPQRLLNCYGPTETTTFALTHTVEAVEKGATTIPIGRPIGNTRVYLLDGHLQPVPVGVTGELYIGGAGVALGYLNRPELTVERFLEDPFRQGGRLYRTGDLGCWRPDGTVEFLGRNDQQVKIRGFRIEPGEIEVVLAEVEGVREVAVAVREEGAGGPRLVVYYTAEEGLDVATLRQAAEQRLPSYMVPAAYVLLGALPLAPNGKLDRSNLPEPADGAYGTRAYEPPLGETEEALARLWGELLKIERVGRQDNFFDLGGHSLLAVRMVARLRECLDLEVPLRVLFSNPTLEAFASAVTHVRLDTLASNLTMFRSGGSTPPIFFIHEGGGGIGFVRELLPGIDAEIPVYGLSAIGQLSGERPLETVEEMAAAYLHVIRQIQPCGPYRLAGWSFGGKVAFEMAHQLLQVDERVAFLGMLDTYFAAPFDAAPSELDYLFYLLRYLLPEAGEPTDALRMRLQELASAGDTRGMLAACRGDGFFPADMPIDALERYFATARAIFQANIDYTPPRLPITVSYFEASEEPRGAVDWWQGWTAVSDATIRIPVAGTHRTMVDAPHGATLGERISQELARMFHPGT